MAVAISLAVALVVFLGIFAFGFVIGVYAPCYSGSSIPMWFTAGYAIFNFFISVAILIPMSINVARRMASLSIFKPDSSSLNNEVAEDSQIN